LIDSKTLKKDHEEFMKEGTLLGKLLKRFKKL